MSWTAVSESVGSYLNVGGIYRAEGVFFDAAQGIGEDLILGDDSEKLSGSLWYRRAELGRSQVLFSFGDQSFGTGFLTFNSSDKLFFSWPDASYSQRVLYTIEGLTDTESWHHLLWSFDLSDTSKRHFLLDGIDAGGTWVTYLSGAMNFQNRSGSTFKTTLIGRTSNHATPTRNRGDLSEFWLAPGEYIDLSSDANLAIFRSGEGWPRGLGDQGEAPTGSPVPIYMRLRPADPGRNDGTSINCKVYGEDTSNDNPVLGSVSPSTTNPNSTENSWSAQTESSPGWS